MQESRRNNSDSSKVNKYMKQTTFLSEICIISLARCQIDESKQSGRLRFSSTSKMHEIVRVKTCFKTLTLGLYNHFLIEFIFTKIRSKSAPFPQHRRQIKLRSSREFPTRIKSGWCYEKSGVFL
jgi:hypothetical protein